MSNQNKGNMKNDFTTNYMTNYLLLPSNEDYREWIKLAQNKQRKIAKIKSTTFKALFKNYKNLYKHKSPELKEIFLNIFIAFKDLHDREVRNVTIEEITTDLSKISTPILKINTIKHIHLLLRHAQRKGILDNDQANEMLEALRFEIICIEARRQVSKIKNNQQETNHNALWTFEDVAESLSCSVSHIKHNYKRWGLSYTKIGRKVYFDPITIDDIKNIPAKINRLKMKKIKKSIN